MPLPVIYFIRHGRTDANRDDIVAGFFESNLLPEGIEQARQAGAFLQDKGLRQIFCSPLQRTRKTLEAMNLSGIPVSFDDRLRELNCGIFEGLPESAVPAPYSTPTILNDFSIRRPQGESINDLIARLSSFKKECLETISVPALVVLHAGSLRALLLSCFPLRHDEIVSSKPGNCEVIRAQNGDYEKVFTPSESAENHA